MHVASNLGLIPNWYYNGDPSQNPMINPYVNPVVRGGGVGFVMVDNNLLRPRSALGGVVDAFKTGGWIFEHRSEVTAGLAILSAAAIAAWLVR